MKESKKIPKSIQSLTSTQLGETGKKEKFVLILPDIRSGHNVGAMFRTGDAVGVDKIYLAGYTAEPTHPHVAKVSLGAEKWIPWRKYKNTKLLVNKLKRAGYNIVGLEQTEKSANIFKWKPKFPLALIVGNEVRGIEPEILKLCDTHLEIPMKGNKESLNVSIAAGVAMYQIANN